MERTAACEEDKAAVVVGQVGQRGAHRHGGLGVGSHRGEGGQHDRNGGPGHDPRGHASREHGDREQRRGDGGERRGELGGRRGADARESGREAHGGGFRLVCWRTVCVTAFLRSQHKPALAPSQGACAFGRMLGALAGGYWQVARGVISKCRGLAHRQVAWCWWDRTRMCGLVGFDVPGRWPENHESHAARHTFGWLGADTDVWSGWVHSLL